MRRRRAGQEVSTSCCHQSDSCSGTPQSRQSPPRLRLHLSARRVSNIIHPVASAPKHMPNSGRFIIWYWPVGIVMLVAMTMT